MLQAALKGCATGFETALAAGRSEASGSALECRLLCPFEQVADSQQQKTHSRGGGAHAEGHPPVEVRSMAFLLSGVPIWDPWTIVGCATLLLITGLAAGYSPSLRATRVHPIVALKHD
jgi:ABC-type antimicrobial peptide transport system permease subunit